MIEKAREIAASFLDPKIAQGTIDMILSGQMDEHMWVRVALRALESREET